jgi:hypothetical protein
MTEEDSVRPPDGKEEPYNWEKCTIKILITILPDDGQEGGRETLVGCSTHRDPPLYETTRKVGLAGLIPVIGDLLKRLKNRLPEQAAITESRLQARKEAREKAAKETAEKLKSQRQQQQQTAAKIKAPYRERALEKQSSPPSNEESCISETAGAKQSSLF